MTAIADVTEQVSTTALHGHFCPRCAKVDTWPLMRVYRDKRGEIEVYECPNCGNRYEYVVRA
jgi:Zn ribbon nucleic-acid-binding protein